MTYGHTHLDVWIDRQSVMIAIWHSICSHVPSHEYTHYYHCIIKQHHDIAYAVLYPHIQHHDIWIHTLLSLHHQVASSHIDTASWHMDTRLTTYGYTYCMDTRTVSLASLASIITYGYSTMDIDTASWHIDRGWWHVYRWSILII